ncbi:mechanosensitive ion channel [Chitinophaga sedimenti]|uniref:mechanosensitive ion channel family protein n=1 Tax=Chitinophaga sedimenti TaxID=2033606 RepID=UPI002005AB9B|nr:mechanosensitive ion channel domain-containing protein [Chitinophaga sedimenti]MCK7556956.1 mechanosensitive ion channel [Chitinophaga sedimenti]
MNFVNVETFWNNLLAWAGRFAPTLIGAIIVLVLGFLIIRWLDRIMTRMMTRRDTHNSLQTFLKSVVSIGLKILLIISVAGMLGFQTTTFAAVIAAAGLAIGLALQGSLANLAGGVLILLFKPFKVGDLVTIQGITGIVKEIQIFSTILTTGDGKVAILPNGAVSNGTIINSSRSGHLRIDVVVKMSANDNFTRVRDIIKTTLEQDKRIKNDPPPEVSIIDFDGDFMNIFVRPFVDMEDYWPVYYDIHQKIQQALLANGMKAPVSTKLAPQQAW